jgi:hypothetical protein
VSNEINIPMLRARQINVARHKRSGYECMIKAVFECNFVLITLSTRSFGIQNRQLNLGINH